MFIIIFWQSLYIFKKLPYLKKTIDLLMQKYQSLQINFIKTYFIVFYKKYFMNIKIHLNFEFFNFKYSSFHLKFSSTFKSLN